MDPFIVDGMSGCEERPLVLMKEYLCCRCGHPQRVAVYESVSSCEMCGNYDLSWYLVEI